MDIRLIVMKPNLTQKRQPLMKFWVQSYLTINLFIFSMWD